MGSIGNPYHDELGRFTDGPSAGGISLQALKIVRREHGASALRQMEGARRTALIRKTVGQLQRGDGSFSDGPTASKSVAHATLKVKNSSGEADSPFRYAGDSRSSTLIDVSLETGWKKGVVTSVKLDDLVSSQREVVVEHVDRVLKRGSYKSGSDKKALIKVMDTGKQLVIMDGLHRATAAKLAGMKKTRVLMIKADPYLMSLYK